MSDGRSREPHILCGPGDADGLALLGLGCRPFALTADAHNGLAAECCQGWSRSQETQACSSKVAMIGQALSLVAGAGEAAAGPCTAPEPNFHP